MLNTATHLERLVNIWDGAIVCDAVAAAENEQQLACVPLPTEDSEDLDRISPECSSTGAELIPFLPSAQQNALNILDRSLIESRRSDDELLYRSLSDSHRAKRPRRLRRRQRPQNDSAASSAARAADMSIPEGDLTVWELCLRNRRPLTDEDRAKIAEQRKARAQACAIRNNSIRALPSVGSNDAGEDISALFDRQLTGGAASSSTTISTGPFTGPSSTSIDSLFDMPFNGDNNADESNRDELFELTIHEGSDSGRLAPFPGAYKVGVKVKWSEEASRRFYDAVEMYGCDAHLINAVLPEFTNKEVTRKIRTELKKNALKMEAATKVRRKLTTSAFVDARGEIDPSTHFRPPALLEGTIGEPFSAKTDGKTEVQTKRDLSSSMGDLMDDLFGAAKTDNGQINNHEVDETPIDEALFESFG